MGVNIHLKPSEVWSFYEDNTARLRAEMVTIAENEETDYAVCLTEENECPLLIVYKGSNRLYEEGVISPKDCEETARRIYFKYLFPVVVNGSKFDVMMDDEPEPEPEPDLIAEEAIQALNDTIYEREDELYFATTEYLEAVLGCQPGELTSLYGDIIDEFCDRVCQMLADEWVISVYRPKWVMNEDSGQEEYEEYPYLDVDWEE